MCIYDDGRRVFRAKKTNINHAKFVDLTAKGGFCKNSSSRVPLFEFQILIAYYIYYETFMGATMTTKGSIL